MAQGPMVINLGNQNQKDWMDALNSGVKAGAILSDVRLAWQQEKRAQAESMFDMMDTMVKELAPYMNLGERDAWQMLLNNGSLGNAFEKIMGKGFNKDQWTQDMLNGLQNDATKPPAFLLREATTEVMLHPEYGVGNQNQQQAPVQNQEQTVTPDFGGTMPPPQATVDYSNPNAPPQPVPTPTYSQQPLGYQARPEGQETRTTETVTQQPVVTETPLNVPPNPPMTQLFPGVDDSLTNAWNALPEEERINAIKDRVISALMEQGRSEQDARQIADNLVAQGMITPNGADLNGTGLENYQQTIMKDVIESKTTRGTYFQSEQMKEIGTFEYTTDEVGVPEAVLTLNENRTFWDSMKDLTNNFVKEGEGGYEVRMNWMKSVEVDDRNLKQLSELCGKSVDELKEMADDDYVEDGKLRSPLGELYSKYSHQMKLHIQYIPGSNTWRDVFGDPEMNENMREEIGDLHKEIQVSLEEGDTSKAVDLQEDVANMIPQEVRYNNRIAELEWMFGVAGMGDRGANPFQEEMTSEDVGRGLQITTDKFLGSEQKMQRMRNEEARAELLIAQEYQKIQTAAALANNGMTYDEWIKLQGLNLDAAEFSWKQQTWTNEQEVKQMDDLQATWDAKRKELDEIAEGLNKNWLNPDDYEELLNNSTFRGTIEEMNRLYGIMNPIPTREQARMSLEEMGATEEQIEEQMAMWEESGVFNEQTASVENPAWWVWEEDKTLPGILGIHPSGGNTAPTQSILSFEDFVKQNNLSLAPQGAKETAYQQYLQSLTKEVEEDVDEDDVNKTINEADL